MLCDVEMGNTKHPPLTGSLPFQRGNGGSKGGIAGVRAAMVAIATEGEEPKEQSLLDIMIDHYGPMSPEDLRGLKSTHCRSEMSHVLLCPSSAVCENTPVKLVATAGGTFGDHRTISAPPLHHH